MGDVACDVCVVGLGASGLTCLLELRRLGLTAVGLDAGTVGGGAAGRNGGFLLAGLAAFHHDAVARYGRDRAAALYRLTIEELERIVALTPELVHRTGSLRIADSPDERADCLRQLDAMHADALPASWYDGPEGEGILVPGDATTNPLARCRALAEIATGLGAALHERSRALHVDRVGVHLTAGVVRCQSVVVAVDGTLERLLPELAGRVRTARLQMLATAPAAEVHFPRPVYTRWGYDYWQQRPDGTIALGGARDAGGDAEWTGDVTPSEPVQRALQHRLRDGLGVHAPITHRWGASVGYTADGLPIAERVRPNVWAIGGYCGTGNVIGSMLGRAAARAVALGDDALLRAFASGGV
ncbi:MAG: dependent oxidoreductase [Gemmatimonadetes bacterium]|nr:dependent oxidoreductase [Gemmatimonadota bacterium]